VRLLACGSREWQDQTIVFTALDEALASDPDLVLIEGEAPGADRIAAKWASERGLEQVGRLLKYPAHWRHNKNCPRDCTEVQGTRAGPIRNRKMLRAGPRKIYAFHPDLSQSAGTLDMSYQALCEGVPVFWWDAEGVLHKPTNGEVGKWKRNREDRKRARKGLDNRNRMF